MAKSKTKAASAAPVQVLGTLAMRAHACPVCKAAVDAKCENLKSNEPYKSSHHVERIELAIAGVRKGVK